MWVIEVENVNILDARNNLSRLVSAAARGEEVVIAKRGKPVVKLVAVGAEQEPQHTGADAAEWLSKHPVPTHAARSAEDIDAQITAEREGWE